MQGRCCVLHKLNEGSALTSRPPPLEPCYPAARFHCSRQNTRHVCGCVSARHIGQTDYYGAREFIIGRPAASVRCFRPQPTVSRHSPMGRISPRSSLLRREWRCLISGDYNCDEMRRKGVEYSEIKMRSSLYPSRSSPLEFLSPHLLPNRTYTRSTKRERWWHPSL